MCLEEPGWPGRTYEPRSLTQSSQGWWLEPGLGSVSPGNYLAVVLVLAMAADQMVGLLHTQLHKVAVCPWRQCGGHSGPGSSAPVADVGHGHCLSQGCHSAWDRSQSASRVVVHPWGHTAEWPLVPRTPHSCKRRVFTQGLMDPKALGQMEEYIFCVVRSCPDCRRQPASRMLALTRPC